MLELLTSPAIAYPALVLATAIFATIASDWI